MVKIKGNLILKQIMMSIVINVIIVPLIFLFMLSVNFGYPNIRLHNGVLKTQKIGNKYTFNIDGFFDPTTNKIDININKPNEEVVRILYHEYGHYIYKNLNKEDKNQWKNKFCKNIDRMEYYRFQICEEEFAEGFSDYLNHEMDTTEKWDYFENIVSKYI